MPNTISGTSIVASLVGTLSKTVALPGGGASASLLYSQNFPLSSGAASGGVGGGASLADEIWFDERTLTSSSNETLDFNTGLTDSIGTSVTLSYMTAIMIFSLAANGVGIVVEGGASNPLAAAGQILGGTAPTITLPPGAMMLFASPGTPWTVSATQCNLKVVNSDSAHSATYDIIVIGS